MHVPQGQRAGVEKIVLYRLLSQRTVQHLFVQSSAFEPVRSIRTWNPRTISSRSQTRRRQRKPPLRYPPAGAANDEVDVQSAFA